MESISLFSHTGQGEQLVQHVRAVKSEAMSVIVSNQDGWILDHLLASSGFLCGTRSHCNKWTAGDKTVKYRLNSDLFEILTPYKMDSQFDKLAAQHTSATENIISRKRKRKRKEPLNIGEQLAVEYHDQVKGYLHQSFKSLIILGQEIGYFQSLSGSQPVNNNLASREAANKLGTNDWLADWCSSTGSNFSSDIVEADILPEMRIECVDLSTPPVIANRELY